MKAQLRFEGGRFQSASETFAPFCFFPVRAARLLGLRTLCCFPCFFGVALACAFDLRALAFAFALVVWPLLRSIV